MVFGPGFVVVARGGPEGAEYAFEVVFIFQPDVLFNQRDSSRDSISRNGCGGHDH